MQVKRKRKRSGVHLLEDELDPDGGTIAIRKSKRKAPDSTKSGKLNAKEEAKLVTFFKAKGGVSSHRLLDHHAHAFSYSRASTWIPWAV